MAELPREEEGISMYHSNKLHTLHGVLSFSLKRTQDDGAPHACFIDRISSLKHQQNLPQVIQLVSDRNW